MNHAKDLIGAISQYYGRDYSRRMAADIADRYAWITPAFKEALYDEVIRSFVPTSTRMLPDMAALQQAERSLPPVETFGPSPGDHTALPGEDDGQLPATCPFCHHPVVKFSAREAICLGEYDERIHRKTGCGAEWEYHGDRWVQGYRSKGKWRDGPPSDLNRKWKSELADGTPAMDLDAMIEDGRKLARARVKGLIDRGEATKVQIEWYANLDKPRPKVPGVKHISEIAEEAEAHW